MPFFKKIKIRGFRRGYLVMFIMWVISLLLGLLAPILGLSEAFQFILIGLGLGALLSWLTSGFSQGSGSPRFRRMHFFNEHPNREALDIKGLKVPMPSPIPPPPPDLPPTIPVVPPQQGGSVIADPQFPFYDGVQKMKVTFGMREPGMIDPQWQYEFTMQVDPGMPYDTAEAIQIAVAPARGDDLHVSAILLHGPVEGEEHQHTFFAAVLHPL